MYVIDLFFYLLFQILTWLFQTLLAFVSLVFVGHISGTSIELDSVGE